MKEKIYTIPITEALEADCSCPFCFLQKKLEDEAIRDKGTVPMSCLK